MNAETHLEQRNILLSEFLDARSLEISQMDRILTDKAKNTNKLVFQLLPKHMRRRPMSHNRYRIPSRIRKELPEVKPNTCRKHLRKKNLLINRYLLRDQRSHWLETHLWHAKRMKMMDYFGFRVALHPNDKSQRACYRFFQHDAVMYDLSYYGILELKGIEEIIKKLMENLINDKELQFLFKKECMNGGKTGRIWLWRDKNQLIGPVEFYWKNVGIEEKKILWFFIHPAMKEEVLEQFNIFNKENLYDTKEIMNEKQENDKKSPQKENNKNIKNKDWEMNFLENQLNVFHIFGPKSLSRVIQALNRLNLQVNHSLLQHFSIITDPEVYPEGAVFYGSLSKEDIIRKKLISDKKVYEDKGRTETYDKLKAKEINKSLIELAKYNFNYEEISQENRIWEISDLTKQNEYLKRFRAVVRGRYTHKKPKKTEKTENGKPIVIRLSRKERKKQKFSEKFQKKLKNVNLKSQNLLLEESKSIEKERNSAQNLEINPIVENKQSLTTVQDLIETTPHKFNIMLSFDHHSKKTGLKIFVPLGSGLLLWRLLSYANIKAIGLREYENLIHETKMLVFPVDFPLTNSQILLSSVIKTKNLEKYIKKPPKNRLNYERIGFPYPFESDFKIIAKNIKDLIAVEIIMISRGVPHERGLICMIKPEDMNIIEEIVKNSMKLKKSEISYKINNSHDSLAINSGIIHRENLKLRSLGNLRKLIPEKLIETLKNIKTDRNIIGFITSGDLSRSECKGKGYGIISKSSINHENQEFYGLIRNPNSRFYYLCEIKPIKNFPYI